MTERIQKTLESTKFAGSQVIPVAAKPGGPEVIRHYFIDLEMCETFVCVFNKLSFRPSSDFFSVRHRTQEQKG